MEQLNSTVVTSNISSSPGYPTPESWNSRGLVPAVMLCLCFLLGVPGNIAVIILKPNWQHLSSVSQSLMLNLAISDLLCLLTLPLWIYTYLYSWTLGLVACKLLTYLVYCSLYCSLLTVTGLSVQRFLQVVYLQKCFHHVGKKRLLALLWLVSMILSIPALVVRQVTTDQDWTHCRTDYFSQNAQHVAVLLTESLIGMIGEIIFDSHHPLEHKLEVIRILHHQADNIPTSVQAREMEHTQLKGALTACGYPKQTFVKTASRPRKNNTVMDEEKKVKLNNIVIPYVYAVSEKLRRIFNKHHILVFFKPKNMLRQMLVHPKDHTPKHKKSNSVCGAMQ